MAAPEGLQNRDYVVRADRVNHKTPDESVFGCCQKGVRIFLAAECPPRVVQQSPAKGSQLKPAALTKKKLHAVLILQALNMR